MTEEDQSKVEGSSNFPVDRSVTHTQDNEKAKRKDIRLLKDHPTDAIIGDITKGQRPRRRNEHSNQIHFTSILKDHSAYLRTQESTGLGTQLLYNNAEIHFPQFLKYKNIVRYSGHSSDHADNFFVHWIIPRNILRQMDQKKASNIVLPSPCVISKYILECRDLYLPIDSWVKKLDTLVMPRLQLLVPPSLTPSILGHKDPKSTMMASPLTPAPSAESSKIMCCIIGVQLGYYLKEELKNKEISKPKENKTLLTIALRNRSYAAVQGVEDLKRFKVKQLDPRGSLEKLKGWCFMIYFSATYPRPVFSSTSLPIYIFALKKRKVERDLKNRLSLIMKE
ncbi:hypothetical protein M9H77_35903 [Catharanthus roseus]|uniref:Uncharacterized protein n=1 Tax=Catharanthus roseus TaxID=4058 RepID=A0ACB9ZS79_CATRO|nr:hypothetical protein M9H77_35903 [Catharanthus roseus]